MKMAAKTPPSAAMGKTHLASSRESETTKSPAKPAIPMAGTGTWPPNK